MTLSSGDVECTLQVKLDPSLHAGTVYVPFNQPGVVPFRGELAVSVARAEGEG